VRGEVLPVWTEMRTHVWDKLERRATDHPDLYCELFRELNSSLKAPKSVEDLADITDNPAQAKRKFRSTKLSEIKSERAILRFLEGAHEVLEELGGDNLANAYYNLLESFLARFSLRYELRRPCSLCPTLPGLFARLMSELRCKARTDPHLWSLLTEFEDSVRDLHVDRTEARLKTCIQKQVNLLEALGRQCQGVRGNTLGAICEQVGSWPHDQLKEALKRVYGFASDYPGIRHGGTPANALRPIELRDLVGVSIALVGFSAYVTPNFDGECVYWEGA
jgi:hypothetical protein